MDNLTYKEMELLFILFRRSPKVVRRTYLLQRLWGRQDAARWMSTSFTYDRNWARKRGNRF